MLNTGRYETQFLPSHSLGTFLWMPCFLSKIPVTIENPMGPCTQIEYTLAPTYTHREYFKAYIPFGHMDPEGNTQLATHGTAVEGMGKGPLGTAR